MPALRFVALAPTVELGSLDRPSIAIAASRTGAIGVVDIEHAQPEPREVFDSLSLCFETVPAGAFGLRLAPGLLPKYLSELKRACSEHQVDHADFLVILAGETGAYEEDLLRQEVELSAVKAGFRTAVEVVSVEEGLLAQSAGAHLLIGKGSESQDRVSESTTFVLLQSLKKSVTLPLFARGGVGEHTVRALVAAGIEGAVLDSQLHLASDSLVPVRLKRIIAAMDGTETTLLKDESGSGPECRRVYMHRTGPDKSEPLHLGQDAALAAGLALKGVSVAGIIDLLSESAGSLMAAGDIPAVLGESAPLAVSHGTRYPIVQGAMTRVSDNADFAFSVAEAGALPFLALSLMRKHDVQELLSRSRSRLEGRAWGVGILGFAPSQLREEQMAAILEHKPPFALIAGGRPDQAKHFEDNGIATYLHVPSPEILASFISEGAKRFVFEGRECGGHVGPRSSFVLWEQMVEVIVRALGGRKDAAEFHVLFAGGIHDSLSAAMTAAIAAPLAAEGVRIGMLLGTAYLFTEEAVSTGAIVERFQKEAIACRRTVLLESGPGHAIRCIESPYREEFEERKQELFGSGRSVSEAKEELELMHLGRLRIASKGVVRDGSSLAPVDEGKQWTEGMYMIGQVAAMHDRTLTMAQLHESIAGGDSLLRSLAAQAHLVESTDCGDGQEPGEPVAIVGMSCYLPRANDVETFWWNIIHKVDAIGEVPSTHFDWRKVYDPDPFATDKSISKWGGFLSNVAFDASTYGIPPNSLSSIDSSQLLMLECVSEALSDAGYDRRKFGREKTAVIVANSGHGPIGALFLVRTMLGWKLDHLPEESRRRIQEEMPQWSEDALPGYLGNVAAGRVSNRFDLGGINLTVDAACASSIAALYLGMSNLRTRESDMVVLGAVDTHNQPIDFVNFSKTHALSPRGRCRTFDATADGIVLGEGLGVVILKRLADAVRDGDRIYSVIRGVGGSSDGRDLSLTAPRPAGQMLALRRAYADAGISPSSVELVEAHGTGTVAGDKAEVRALSRVFADEGAALGTCAIGSVKSNIGHTKCTAGLASLIKVSKALYHKVLPPTIGVEQPNPSCGFGDNPFYINSEARPWIRSSVDGPRRAALSAFGFGGTNFHAVLEEYRPVCPPEAIFGSSVWPREIFVFSADSTEELGKQLSGFKRKLDHALSREVRLSRPEESSLERKALLELSRLLVEKAQIRGTRAFRLAFVAGSPEEVEKKINLSFALLKNSDSKAGAQGAPGIYLRRDPKPGKIAFLFPGQGSQRLNMLRELAVFFPELTDSLEKTDSFLQGKLDSSLRSYIFPPPSFDGERLEAAKAALNDTAVAQPAMGAADMAMLCLARSLGLRPDIVAGHSYGEYPALVCAGVLNEGDMLDLSIKRGRILARTGEGDNGAMVAALATEESVRSLTEKVDGVVIANLNSPEQCIVSGTTAGIEEFCRLAADRGVPTRPVPVSRAFHSPIMAGSASELGEALEAVSIKSPAIPVFSNTSGDRYPDSPQAIRSLLVEHAVKPVLFKKQIEAMHEQGASTFIEVGPGQVLTGMVEATLQGRDVTACSLGAGADSGAGLPQLLDSLARLWVAGVDIDLGRLYAGRRTYSLDPRPMKMPYLINSCAVEKAQPKTEKRKLEKADRASRAETVIPAAGIESLKPANSATPPAPNGKRPALNQALKDALGRQTVPAGEPRMPVVPGGVEAMILEYQRNMMEMTRSLVDAQKEVMLAYLGSRNGSSFSSGSSSVPAQIQVQAPVLQGLPEQFSQSDSGNGNGNGKGSEVDKTESDSGSNSGIDSESLIASLLEIVSDRTGYPSDMLEPTLDLEADLGIDSIKRIEIFNSFRKLLPEMVQQELEGNLEELASLKTLESIFDWVRNLETRTYAGAASTETSPVTHSNSKSAIARGLVRLTDLDLKVEPDIRLVKGPVLVVAASAGRSSAPATGLAARIEGALIKSVAEVMSGDFRTYLKKEKPETIFYLAGLDQGGQDESGLAGLLELARAIKETAGGGYEPSLIVATGMGGRFGHDQSAPRDPRYLASQAALCGMTKTIDRELEAVRTLYIDIEPGDENAVSAILTLAGKGESGGEYGFRDGSFASLTIEPAPFTDASEAKVELDSGSLVLVTGGARGITAEIAAELAASFGCHFVILGRAERPGPESAVTAGLDSAREIKSALMEDFRSRNEAVNIKEIEKLYQKIVKEREIRDSLARIEASAASVRYHALDVRDEAAFSELIGSLYDFYGNIDGVIHGAGVIEDSYIEKKSFDSFRRVYDTKVIGLVTLAAKLRLSTLKFLYAFSSVVGRTGNPGQVDYVAANEALNKLALHLDRLSPARLGSIMWGPWRAGMAPPELEDVFASFGWAMIEPEDGRRTFVRELLSGRKGDVEIMLVGEPVAGTGSSSDSVASKVDEATGPEGPVVSPAGISSFSPFEAEVEIDRANHIYLEDHKLDDMPVLPMAVALETMLECAALARPGRRLKGISGFDIPSGVIFDTDRKRFLVKATDLGADRAELTVESLGRVNRLHHRGVAEYAREGEVITLPPELQTRIPARFDPSLIESPELDPPHRDHIYSNWMFHGPLFQGIESIDRLGPRGVAGAVTGRAPGLCLRDPLRDRWIMDPILFDCSMQLGAVWVRFYSDITCLPTGFKQLHLLRPCPQDSAYVHVFLPTDVFDGEVVCDLAIYDSDRELSVLVEGLTGVGSKSFNRFASVGKTV